MLGYVAGVDGVTENMSCPVDPNDASKGSIPLNKNGFDVSPDDPHHDLDSIAFQNNNGLMNGFVQSQVINNQNVSNPVSMFDKSNAPIINTLAEEYAVFDKWFCSVSGGAVSCHMCAYVSSSACHVSVSMYVSIFVYISVYLAPTHTNPPLRSLRPHTLRSLALPIRTDNSLCPEPLWASLQTSTAHCTLSSLTSTT